MKINLNIIKILFVLSVLGSTLHAEYTWMKDICQISGCKGCSDFEEDVKKAAESIDTNHTTLEKNVAKEYNKTIIIENIIKIDTIQAGITKSVAHIRELGHAADIESKELIFILRKNKALYSLPTGVE